MIDISMKSIDRNNMYERIVNFYQQFIDGIVIGKEAFLGEMALTEFENVVLAGMGGSAISGDLLRSVLLDELKIPFSVHRNYGLPNHAGKGSLVICSSYSGNTEETLSAFQTALERDCRILCISTGGKLSELAIQNNIPWVKMPAGMMMPREALGLSFIPLLIVSSRLGLCSDYSSEIGKCADLLKEWQRQYQFESKENIAVNLAEKLAGKIVVIYSGPDRFDTVAMRFKGQICENAKQLVFCNVFPEFNHNELVGWELSSSYSDKFIILIIRDKDDHPQIIQRIETVKKIFSEKKVEVTELFSKGESVLARIFSLIQIADFTSYYMALKNKVDPTPINLIEYLKKSIARNKENQ